MTKKVRIKTWDEMLKIGKLDSEGSIKIDDNVFVPTMENYLPDDRIIVIDDNEWDGWYFTEGMIAEVIDD